MALDTWTWLITEQDREAAAHLCPIPTSSPLSGYRFRAEWASHKCSQEKLQQSSKPASPHLRVLLSQEEENDTKQGPAHPQLYLVFSSFTRIALQKPRSIVLLWKRDSCPRGDRDSMSSGGLHKPAKERPCYVSYGLCLMDCHVYQETGL